MSNQYLERLIHSTYNVMPQLTKTLQVLPLNKFYLNYPLLLEQEKSVQSKSIFLQSSYYLKSQKLIRPNNHVFMISASQIFASTNFTGASNSEQISLEMKLAELKEKYEIFDQDKIHRIKLTVAVQANLLEETMDLHQLAKYVLKSKKNPSVQNFIKTHANSGFLKSIFNSNKLAISTAHNYLSKSFLRTMKIQQFGSAYEMVRYFSKPTNQVRVIFPFCQNIKHSFNPNCQVKAMFLTHRRETFLTLTSLKQIKEGDQLTINYGNQNNYQMLIRYGFTIENNPFTEFYLPVDYSDIEEIFSQNMDWKMEMFKRNKKLKLKNFVRINSKGQLHPDDLIMLKIVFTTSAPSEVNRTPQYQAKLQEQINAFIKKTSQKFIHMLQRLIQKKKQISNPTKPENQLEQTTLHHIRVIENEERQILNLLAK